MANQVDPRFAGVRPADDATAGFDAGLRAYMLSVYNYMATGVLMTGAIAYLVANTPALLAVFFAVKANGAMGPTILGWVAMLSPLALILVMNFGMNKLSESTLKLCFYGFAALMGVSMSTIFIVYTGASIAQTFFVTAAAFAGLSLYGYTTKRDLSAMGKFLVMGLIGLIVAMFANFFFKSGPLQLGINIIGVLIFAGLIAYDTQRLKNLYFQVQGSDIMGKTAIMGALTLYLNFINMFQFLLHMMGNRN
ncbi:membrane protein [Polymorphobacter glacialis]|uniref:Membrane protein n=1 Tax=Sandarakinorhabdus glacialis TaxID=1614636 RepID=A0A916ZJB1_9SPHN|nr:Bax inhibitor-1/YccA family protein [Polymorphobacter glacialis]GGD99273.1 membrane protein [Polymorphobacter glacialis]